MTATFTTRSLDDAGRALLFTDARTANSFSDEPVSDETLREIWELSRWAPSAANTQPLRVLFVRTPEAKQRLNQHMAQGNQAKTLAAPVTAILAVDSRFHDHIPTLLPFRPEMRDFLEQDADARESMGLFNATLQAGYFILGVRAVGLVAGPMKGYDAAGIDAEFFADRQWNTILSVNIGHPGENPWFDRLPRLEHDDVLQWA